MKLKYNGNGVKIINFGYELLQCDLMKLNKTESSNYVFEQIQILKATQLANPPPPGKYKRDFLQPWHILLMMI